MYSRYDYVTPEVMNNIEQKVVEATTYLKQFFALPDYTPKTWLLNEKIYVEDIAHIENQIKTMGDLINSDSWIANKEWEDGKLFTLSYEDFNRWIHNLDLCMLYVYQNNDIYSIWTVKDVMAKSLINRIDTNTLTKTKVNLNNTINIKNITWSEYLNKYITVINASSVSGGSENDGIYISENMENWEHITYNTDDNGKIYNGILCYGNCLIVQKSSSSVTSDLYFSNDLTNWVSIKNDIFKPDGYENKPIIQTHSYVDAYDSNGIYIHTTTNVYGEKTEGVFPLYAVVNQIFKTQDGLNFEKIAREDFIINEHFVDGELVTDTTSLNIEKLMVENNRIFIYGSRMLRVVNNNNIDIIEKYTETNYNFISLYYENNEYNVIRYIDNELRKKIYDNSLKPNIEIKISVDSDVYSLTDSQVSFGNALYINNKLFIPIYGYTVQYSAIYHNELCYIENNTLKLCQITTDTNRSNVCAIIKRGDR